MDQIFLCVMFRTLEKMKRFRKFRKLFVIILKIILYHIGVMTEQYVPNSNSGGPINTNRRVKSLLFFDITRGILLLH